MNYKVLYRKYRPNNFDELVGQETVKTLLKDSIINKKISHAYIFSGPRGTGKTSTAKIFAKAINCQNNINGNPCCSCGFCENFSIFFNPSIQCIIRGSLNEGTKKEGSFHSPLREIAPMQALRLSS